MTDTNKNQKGTQLTNPLQKGSIVTGCRNLDENFSQRFPTKTETYSKGNKNK